MTAASSLICFLMFISGLRAEEVATPSSLLTPRNFNHHSYDLKQYFKLLKKPKPTKQGPVLFPNDGAPPPRLPLVVTSRPLLESIAASDLTPSPPNNTVAEQSQISRVTFKPAFLTKFDQYQPLTYSVAPLPLPAYEDAVYPDSIPYADVVNKVRGSGASDNRYSDYEERRSLPPIYKALSDYAQSRVLKTAQKPPRYHYKINEPDNGRNYENNELADGNDNTEYSEGDNYAFSYTVKDRDTGDDFSHRQHSSGSATNGEYRVRLPDGRMQIVSYTADENGYKADVRYDNEDNNEVNTRRNDNNNKDTDYKLSENLNQIKDYEYKSVANPTHTDYNSEIIVDNDYTQRDFNVKPARDDYFHSYEASREYYNDYSAEYTNNYDTHRSKFIAFKPSTTPTPIYTTIRPSHEDIKESFTIKPFEPKVNYVSDRVVEINAPSTANYNGVTEDVVVIAPKLYTHVRSSTPLVETINTTPKPIIVTPASYLASTIASIKERIRASKPILGNDFLQRINKYLTFT